MVIEVNDRRIETKEILDGFLYSYCQLDTSAVGASAKAVGEHRRANRSKDYESVQKGQTNCA